MCKNHLFSLFQAGVSSGTHRRTWDRDTYARKAADREEQERKDRKERATVLARRFAKDSDSDSDDDGVNDRRKKVRFLNLAVFRSVV